jgi:hypothetical protein
MDAIERFGKRLHEAFEKGVQSGRLAHVGGNFSIVVHEKAVWTVITKGPKPCIVEAITEDRMDFIMISTLDVFEQMYCITEGEEPDIDIDATIAAKKIAMHGDLDVFIRFIALNGAGDMLSLRANGAKAISSRKTSKKRAAI